MRQINIKQLNKHLSAELKNIPFAVTKNGRVVGVMVAPDAVSPVLLSTDNPVKTIEKSTDIIKAGGKVLTKPKTTKQKNFHHPSCTCGLCVKTDKAGKKAK